MGDMTRRRGNGRNLHSCGHVGKGATCHRCEHADFLDKAAESGTKFVTNKKVDKKTKKPKSGKPKLWSKQEMLDEALRLRQQARRV